MELYPCTCKEELNAREGHNIREKGTSHMYMAGTNKQHTIQRRQQITSQKTMANIL